MPPLSSLGTSELAPPLPTTAAPPRKPSLTVVCPQLGVKALTYSDLIQAQKEISAHNQQLREQTEQLEKDNRELRSQSLQLVRAQGGWQFQHIPEGAGALDPRLGRGPGVPQLTDLEASVLICVLIQRNDLRVPAEPSRFS